MPRLPRPPSPVVTDVRHENTIVNLLLHVACQRGDFLILNVVVLLLQSSQHVRVVGFSGVTRALSVSRLGGRRRRRRRRRRRLRFVDNSIGFDFDNGVGLLVPHPVAGLAASLGHDPSCRQDHGLVHALEHVVHGQAGHRCSGHGFHLDACFAFTVDRGHDGDAAEPQRVLTQSQRSSGERPGELVAHEGFQTHLHTRDGQTGMCERDEVGSFLCGLDPGDASHGDGITLAQTSCEQSPIRLRVGEQKDGRCCGGSSRWSLARDRNHVRFTI